MIPMHLATSTPSTSHPNGRVEMMPRTIGVHGGGTVRYVYPIPVPMVGSVPLRVRVRPPFPVDDGVRFEALTVGPRSNFLDPRRQSSRPTTVAARKRQNSRPPIFEFIQNTPSRHEPTYDESSQFNPAQLDTVSISARRNSQSRASQVNGSNHGGTVMMYDQQPHSMIPGGFVAPYEAIPVPPPMPFWYPPPPPPPPFYVPPMDAKMMRKVYKKAMEAEKRFQSKSKSSGCQQFCCGGAASLFWILLFLIILAAIAVLVVALIYI